MSSFSRGVHPHGGPPADGLRPIPESTLDRLERLLSDPAAGPNPRISPDLTDEQFVTRVWTAHREWIEAYVDAAPALIAAARALEGIMPDVIERGETSIYCLYCGMFIPSDGEDHEEGCRAVTAQAALEALK